MTTLVDAPTRADGVQLLGETVGSGYRTPPALVRRSDGQVIQLTPLLYLVLSATDGRRSAAEIAEVVSHALRRGVSEEVVTSMVDGHLRPLGLLKRADGSDPEVRRSDPLLGLKLRKVITDPRTTHRLTDPFRVLFHPVVTLAVFLGFVAVVSWVFFERGLGAAAYDAFDRPHLLLLVFVVSIVSGGFHEFGHAAAARYGGAEPGAMGAGLYLVWPAFYTDVTDSYRLGRGGRIRTDLGGLYFNAIVVVVTFVWWWSTGWDALLLLVATQVLQMAQQLLPLLRFDGYHVLADVAGVPDLYQRIRPTLVGLLPHKWRSPENRMIKPWSRAVITLWVFITVPMMLLMLLALISSVPRVVGSAGAVVGEDVEATARAFESGGAVDVVAHVLQVLGVVLPMVAGALILGRVGTRFFGGLARWGRGSLLRRAVSTFTAVAAVTVLIWAWWPHPGAYRPIQAGEKGLFTAVLQEPGAETADPARTAVGAEVVTTGVPIGSAARTRLGGDEPLVTAFEKGSRLPTEKDPQLALVLVPSDEPGTDGPPTEGPVTEQPVTEQPGPEQPGADPQPWVFPFDAPLAPAEGDNQALAVNTTDGSITYDVAFALVWAEGDEVLNVNEAHAYASCSDCVAVAVAFQVVLIMDDAQVVVPQNLAVAANYDCYRCITAAIANQLVLSVERDAGGGGPAGPRRGVDRADAVRAVPDVVLAGRDRRPAGDLQGRDHRDPRGGATGGGADRDRHPDPDSRGRRGGTERLPPALGLAECHELRVEPDRALPPEPTAGTPSGGGTTAPAPAPTSSAAPAPSATPAPTGLDPGRLDVRRDVGVADPSAATRRRRPTPALTPTRRVAGPAAAPASLCGHGMSVAVTADDDQPDSSGPRPRPGRRTWRLGKRTAYCGCVSRWLWSCGKWRASSTTFPRGLLLLAPLPVGVRLECLSCRRALTPIRSIPPIRPLRGPRPPGRYPPRRSTGWSGPRRSSATPSTSAGEFTSARPAGAAPGVNEVPRSNLLAYDIRTGVLSSTWVPSTNAERRRHRGLPGRLPALHRRATSRPSTGRPSAGSRPSTRRPATGSRRSTPTPTAASESVVATNTTVYFGGYFGAVGGLTRAALRRRSRVGRRRALPGRRSRASGFAWDMALSPDNSQVLAGGFVHLGQRLRPTPGLGMASIDAVTGALRPWAANSLIRNSGAQSSAITSVESAGGLRLRLGCDLFARLSNLEGVVKMDWNGGGIVWVEDCHGDSLDTYPVR